MVTGTFCRGRCPHRPVRYNIRMCICSGSVQTAYSAFARRYIRVWLPGGIFRFVHGILRNYLRRYSACRGAFRAPAPFLSHSPAPFIHVSGKFLFAVDFVFHGAMWASPPTARCPTIYLIFVGRILYLAGARNAPLLRYSSSIRIFQSSNCIFDMSTFRGFEPSLGPIMPRSSSSSMIRDAFA